MLPTGGGNSGLPARCRLASAVTVRGILIPLLTYLGNLAVAQANKSRVDTSEPVLYSVARDVDAFRRASDEPGGSQMPMHRL